MQVDSSVFESFPVIKTKRLLLRDFKPEDAEAIFEMRRNQKVNQFIARPGMESLEQAKELVQKVKTTYSQKQGIGWAAMLRDNNSMIGACGLNRIEYENLRAEIGGEMSTRYWGKGIALEAVEAIVNFAFDTVNLHSIEARVWPENRGAIFLLETLGFKKEAHLKDALFYNDKFMDVAFYSLVSR
jgi:ribosomal-protein-alanine N-acetyltransferase